MFEADDLRVVFEPFGNVQSIWVAQNPPGYAFIGFESDRDAHEAWKQIDGQTLHNRRIKVNASFRSTQRNAMTSGMGPMGPPMGPIGHMGGMSPMGGGYQNYGGGGYGGGGMAGYGGGGGRFYRDGGRGREAGGYGGGYHQGWGGDYRSQQHMDPRMLQAGLWPEFSRGSSAPSFQDRGGSFSRSSAWGGSPRSAPGGGGGGGGGGLSGAGLAGGLGGGLGRGLNGLGAEAGQFSGDFTTSLPTDHPRTPPASGFW
jgi:hypothetical protein